MDIFILSPNASLLFDKQLSDQLNRAGKVTLIDKITPLDKVTALYESTEPKILAIDPDFCDWKVPNEIIDKISNLKCICLQTTSFSWVDIEHAKSKSIPVTNLRGFSSIGVAEWSTMMALALARKLPLVMKDSWKPDVDKHRGVQLRGKTAGIVGLGRIGTAFAEDMVGLGMKVQYWSKNTKDERFKYVSLDELMLTSDLIFPAVAHNEETERLISDDLLRSVKQSAIIVRIVHPIFNHELVLQMVKDGKLYGYGFEEETDKPFGSYEGNIWNGPALGWATDQSMRNNAEQWVKSIVDAAGDQYPTRVNI